MHSQLDQLFPLFYAQLLLLLHVSLKHIQDLLSGIRHDFLLKPFQHLRICI